MFDIGAWELLIIGALALIVVGPKELPRLVRSVGKWVHKARSMAREFQRGMEEAAREADLDDLKNITDVRKSITDEVRSIGADAKRTIEGAANVNPRREPPSDRSGGARSEPRSDRPEPRADRPEPRADRPEPRSERADPPVAPNRAAALDPDDDARLQQFERGVRGRS